MLEQAVNDQIESICLPQQKCPIIKWSPCGDSDIQSSEEEGNTNVLFCINHTSAALNRSSKPMVLSSLEG